MNQYKLVPIEPTKQMMRAFYAVPVPANSFFEAYKAMLSAAPDVGGEAVAYRHLHDDGFEYYDAPTGEDCAECQPLYTYPPDAAKRIADLEADKARLVEALKSSNVFLDPFDDKVQLAINSNLIAEMEGKA